MMQRPQAETGVLISSLDEETPSDEYAPEDGLGKPTEEDEDDDELDIEGEVEGDE